MAKNSGGLYHSRGEESDEGFFRDFSKLGTKVCCSHPYIAADPIFTDAWQRNIRAARVQNSAREKFAGELGEPDFTRVEDFARWLSNHEKRHAILNYLQFGSR